MKFCKKYEEVMQALEQKKIPRIDCGALNNILQTCREQIHPTIIHQNPDINNNININITNDALAISADPQHCSVCSGRFFPLLQKEMSGVVGFFNGRARKLVDRHLASGCRKWYTWSRDRLVGNDEEAEHIKECENLIAYAGANAIAMRRMLNKYDKICYSKRGQSFKSRAVSMQIEILHSPWLYELVAFHINVRDGSKLNTATATAALQLEGKSLVFDYGRPKPSLLLFDSAKLNIELTCSICLETLFDPVSLGCGHLFCYLCACKASSVSIVDGLKVASPDKTCPVCREGGIFESAVHLEEVHILLKRSWPEYWEERRKAEKAERVELAKQHWHSQSVKLMGF